jgi:uncharacterized protein YkwD
MRAARRWVILEQMKLSTLALALCVCGCSILDEVREESQPVPEGDPAEVLALANDARSTGRVCGSQSFGPAGGLGWNDKLGRAAQLHADDMASHDFMSHTGSDGSDAAQRISREGYQWSAIGENVAAGQPSPQEVMNSWLTSPGHCANIMNPSFEHMGIGRAAGGSLGVYWAQTFARPQ